MRLLDTGHKIWFERFCRARKHLAADKGLVLDDSRALLGPAVLFHGVYNLLIAYGGWVQYAAYTLPVLAVVAGNVFSLLLRLQKE